MLTPLFAIPNPVSSPALAAPPAAIQDTHQPAAEPELLWNTFLGGPENDAGYSIAFDRRSDVYVAGTSDSGWGEDAVAGHSGGRDVFVAKMVLRGVVEWHTFLDAATGDETCAIALDGEGNVYVTGTSWEPWGDPVNDFSFYPDAFVAKLDNDGNLLWNTFLGAVTDSGNAIALDASSNVYIAGASTLTWGDPVRDHWGAHNNDAFVAKLDNDGRLVWNAFLGGEGEDTGQAIAVDASGHIYVAGTSGSAWGSPQAGFAGGTDAFVAKTNANGSLMWHTFLGDEHQDTGAGIAVDSSSAVYIAGTQEQWVEGRYGPELDQFPFATRLAPGGVQDWTSQYFDGEGHGIAVDGDGQIYLAGTGEYEPYGVNYAFVAALDGEGNRTWDVELGGPELNDVQGRAIAVDPSGHVYLAGTSYAEWGDWPTRRHAGGYDAFAAFLGAPCTGDGIYLYEQPYYMSECRKLTASEPDLARLSFDDQADSIKFVGAYGDGQYLATVYEHANYTGASRTLMADDPLLGEGAFGWDAASSIRIEPAPQCDGQDGVYLWEEPNYMGQCRRFTASEADLSNVAFQNIARSVEVVGDTFGANHEVVLFGYPDFVGVTKTVAGQDADLGNDAIKDFGVSSLAIWPKTKDWTFLLYLNGDQREQDLTGPFNDTLRNLLREGEVNPNLNVVVLFDGKVQGDTWQGRILPGSWYQTPGDTQWDLGERDLGDGQTLVDFVQWARGRFPADHYYLSIADHGNGVVGISWDDDPNEDSYLNPSELAAALDAATLNGSQRDKIDVVHYDTCLMAMLENGYDIHDYADYLVAHQNLGWSTFPYKDYLAGIDTGMGAGEMAIYMADAYYEARRYRSRTPASVSVMDLRRAVSVREALDPLATALRTEVSADLLRQLRDSTQQLDANGSLTINNEDDYSDLCHLASLVQQQVPTDTVKLRAAAVEAAACTSPSDPLVIREHHINGIYGGISINLQNAHGVSVYWPQTSGGVTYNQYTGGLLYDFTADSQWDEFVARYATIAGEPPLPDDEELPLVPVLTEQEVWLPVIHAATPNCR
jgi:hypothetical protein